MRIYLDTEFTSLDQDAKLISLALVDSNGRSLYIEVKNCELPNSEWLEQNVYPHLQWRVDNPDQFYLQNEQRSVGYLPIEEVAHYIELWLLKYPNVEIWADCVVWDWLLFCQIFGGALHIPSKIFYLPFDLVTLLPLGNLSPNVCRQKLTQTLQLTQQLEANTQNIGPHSALYDAHRLRAIAEHILGGHLVQPDN